jgi:hypothetical protein
METELSISDGVRIVGARSQLRAAILWRGFVLGMGKLGHHFSGGMILSEIRHWQCDANHENSLWNLDAIRRTSSRLNSLAADSPARLVLEIDVSERLPVVIVHDEAGFQFFD